MNAELFSHCDEVLLLSSLDTMENMLLTKDCVSVSSCSGTWGKDGNMSIMYIRVLYPLQNDVSWH
jgi:hypothetical protein